MRKFVFIALFFTFLLAACSNSQTTSGGGKNILPAQTPGKTAASMKPAATGEISKLAEIYSLAMDSFMPIDEGLNGDMKYIAVDTKTLKNATDADKKWILKYFEKYNVKVMDESFESLKAKGMVKSGNSLEGILLRLESVEFKSDKEVIVQGSKFRSGLGAIGVRCILQKEDKGWKVKEAGMMWIS